jgi:tetratricopeptide (TPR) repeat protein
MTDTNVRLQNLRDFTVQIRRADSDAIVGTGIAVSTDGKIVTCAHVVEAAGIDPRAANGAEVGVYFPQARGGEEKKRRATVARYFSDYDDDIVLLQLVGDPSPLAPEQIPVLGTANCSDENPFRSYGYRRLEKYIAGWADGKIQGCVEAPPDFNVQCEPVQLESSQINCGMSGSAVLDIDRNLVVGIVSETWFPDLSTKDRDTAWAVDGRVLSLEPLGLPLQDIPLPLKAAPEPKFDAAQAKAAVSIVDKYSWNNAPQVLPEWVGRDDLLAQITSDWMNPQKHVTGLIGFGGEGKSSLARKWVDDVIARSRDIVPEGGAATKQSPTREEIASGSALAMTLDGVFWWGFYENRSVDEFLEAALNYLSGGRIDPQAVPSASLRAQIIGAMLASGRYLFVLDGLEVLQHPEGDQYGLLQNNDLRDLLTYFARPDNQSFCLVTSRAPLLDLMDYTTYSHRDVDRLSEKDGRDLLRKLGVKGTDAQLDKIVADWDGHALTISLLGSYLAEKHGGDIAHLDDIPIPTADEPRYQRVQRVLRRYDEHLSETEREFLKLFSAFRTPVHESAFEKVFAPLLPSLGGVGAQYIAPLPEMVNRLVHYRLLRHDPHEDTYTAHPLIRNHYFALFTKGDPSQEKTAHEQIKDYYLSIAGDTPEYPTLDDLKPLIEVVHHACEAGAYDEARDIYWQRIRQGEKRVTIHKLGAYETELSLISEFFPSRDLAQEPAGNNQEFKRFLINAVGLCLTNVGRLREAVPFYERAIKAGMEVEDWRNTSRDNQNLAGLHALLGALAVSAESAAQALDLARRAEDKNNEIESLYWQAWTAHLVGNNKFSSEVFLKADKLDLEVYPNLVEHLHSLMGTGYSEHLRRINDLTYARQIAESSMRYAERNHSIVDLSRCHRVLGDLDSDAGQHETAREHYGEALRIARGISARDVLIEALLGRGRWQAKHIKDPSTGSGQVPAAFSDLNEALGYCVESGYRIYEADVRNALGLAWLAKNEKQKAKESAERALQMSTEMGYYWGKLDAQEVLKVIGNE